MWKSCQNEGRSAVGSEETTLLPKDALSRRLYWESSKKESPKVCSSRGLEGPFNEAAVLMRVV